MKDGIICDGCSCGVRARSRSRMKSIPSSNDGSVSEASDRSSDMSLSDGGSSCFMRDAVVFESIHGKCSKYSLMIIGENAEQTEEFARAFFPAS